MYSHLKSGGAAKWHHCVENWCSKGVEVTTCSKFKNNLTLTLSVQFHRENWAVRIQSNYVLPNSRFHQIVPLNKSSSRKPQWRKIVYILHVEKLHGQCFTAKLGLCFPGVFEWRPLQLELKQGSSFRQPFLAKRKRLYCREWSLRYMKGFVFQCCKLHIFRDHELSILSLLLFVFFRFEFYRMTHFHCFVLSTAWEFQTPEVFWDSSYTCEQKE